MVILRSGLDKIMFSVYERDYRKYSYPKDIAMKYADRLERIHFSDRSAFSVRFDKYPHKTWITSGKEKSTYAVEYFLRLDGMRQMRVYLNCMRLFNVKHDLTPSPKALWDDNFVDPDVIFTMATFIQLVKDELQAFKQDYITVRKEVFDEEIKPQDVVISTHTLEAVREGLGLHTTDISRTFKDKPMCDSVKVYGSETNTHYFNTTAKRQIKFYNKGIGVLRMEATFNENPSEIVFHWNAPTYDIAQSIEMEIDTLLFDMNIPNDWYDAFQIKRENLLWLFAQGLGLITREIKDKETGEIIEEGGIVMVDVLKWLLNNKQFPARADRRTLFQRLKRKRLIEPDIYRVWKPTERLLQLQNLFEVLDRKYGVFEDNGI